MLSSVSTGHSTESGGIRTVRLWFKSFIPFDLEGTQPVPAGPHAGKSMFRSPGPIEAWFLTDQRAFSSDPAASARMHSEIELDLLDFRVIRTLHKCDPTIQVDQHTGIEDCCETADTSDMYFSDVNLSREERRVSMHLHGSTKNACLKVGPVKVSPNLDCEADIVLRLHPEGREAVLQFDGQIEPYPAFEMYVTVNGGPPIAVFQEQVEPGSTPLILFGPPQREVHTSITLSCPIA